MSIKQRGDVIPAVKLREPFILLFLNTFCDNLHETQRAPWCSSGSRGVITSQAQFPHNHSTEHIRWLQGAVPYKEQLNLGWHIPGNDPRLYNDERGHLRSTYERDMRRHKAT